VATFGLSACTNYGLGIGSPGYYDPYYGSGYGGYGAYGYGSPYGAYGYGYPYGVGYSPYGWYDNYYYPGTGYYVYSRDGSRHRWSDAQRRYWEGRRNDGVKRNGYVSSDVVRRQLEQQQQQGVVTTRSSDRVRDWSGDSGRRSRSWSRESVGGSEGGYTHRVNAETVRRQLEQQQGAQP
jgi:hypothetical protein